MDGGRQRSVDASRMREVPCRRCNLSTDDGMSSFEEGVDLGASLSSLFIEEGMIVWMVLSTTYLTVVLAAMGRGLRVA